MLDPDTAALADAKLDDALLELVERIVATLRARHPELTFEFVIEP